MLHFAAGFQFYSLKTTEGKHLCEKLQSFQTVVYPEIKGGYNLLKCVCILGGLL